VTPPPTVDGSGVGLGVEGAVGLGDGGGPAWSGELVAPATDPEGAGRGAIVRSPMARAAAAVAVTTRTVRGLSGGVGAGSSRRGAARVARRRRSLSAKRAARCFCVCESLVTTD
jgi:hypothetical protein